MTRLHVLYRSGGVLRLEPGMEPPRQAVSISWVPIHEAEVVARPARARGHGVYAKVKWHAALATSVGPNGAHEAGARLGDVQPLQVRDRC